jgi:hypothetical protein
VRPEGTGGVSRRGNRGWQPVSDRESCRWRLVTYGHV